MGGRGRGEKPDAMAQRKREDMDDRIAIARFFVGGPIGGETRWTPGQRNQGKLWTVLEEVLIVETIAPAEGAVRLRLPPPGEDGLVRPKRHRYVIRLGEDGEPVQDVNGRFVYDYAGDEGG